MLLVGVSGLLIPSSAVVIQSSRSCIARGSYVPQEVMPRQERAAIVLRGESFRWGQQYSRDVSRNSDLQLEATRSQIKLLVEPLENSGLKTDVFMATYKTHFFHKLLNAWGKRLKAYRLSKRPGSQEQSVWDAVSLAWSYMKKQPALYRFVVVMRHDMVLKQDLARRRFMIYHSGPSWGSPMAVREQCWHESPILGSLPDLCRLALWGARPRARYFAGDAW